MWPHVATFLPLLATSSQQRFTDMKHSDAPRVRHGATRVALRQARRLKQAQGLNKRKTGAPAVDRQTSGLEAPRPTKLTR